MSADNSATGLRILPTQHSVAEVLDQFRSQYPLPFGTSNAC